MEVFTGYVNPETASSVGPLQHHKPVEITRDDLNRLLLVRKNYGERYVRHIDPCD
jgi:hypothetical protein